MLIKQNQEQLTITAIRNIIENLEGKSWKNLSETVCNKLCNLALAIGKVLQQDAFEDSLKVAADYKNISILKSIKPDAWLSDRNPCLVHFLQGVTGVDGESITSKKENAFCHLIEQVLYKCNLNILTPFPFKRNLITYSITNS